MSDALLVITTMPDQAGAEALARALVEKHLAACVNIGAPVTSIYEWDGELQHGTERMLTIKTTRERYAAIEQTITERHPYELPEVIAVPITAGLKAYLAWIETCTKN